MEEDKRIPDLPELTVVNGELYFAIYDPVTDTTYRIKASLIIPGLTSDEYTWDPNVSYALDDIVVFGDEVWISQQNGNLSVTPGTDAAYWVADNKSQGSAIKFWTAGVYSEADVYVAGRNAQNHLFLWRLATATRPFNSTNFLTEIANGTWEPFGKSYIDDLTNGLSWKPWAHAASTGNLVLSGTQTVDTRALGVGNICLAKNQTDPKENGWWTVKATAWTRCTFADSSSELSAAVGYVSGGAVNAGKTFKQTTEAPTIGVSNIVFEEFARNFFRGVYVSEAALNAAIPTGTLGDYADVDTGVGDDVVRYIWDDDDDAWVPGGSGGLTANASETVAGIVEEATDAQTQAGTSVGETGAKLFVGPAKLATWWTWVKSQAQTITGAWVFASLRVRNLADTFTSVIQHSGTAARTYTLQDRDGTIAHDTDLDLIASAISSGTLTLDLNSQRQRRFLLSLTASANFTLALSNTTNARIFTLDLNITGTVAITMPSTFRMAGEDTSRWNSTTRILTLVGTTDQPFELSATFDGTVWKLKASRGYL